MKNICCICDSDRQEAFFREVDGFTLVRCRKCDLVYLREINSTDVDFIDTTKQIALKNQKGKGSLEYWGFPHLYKKYRSIFDGFFEERWRRLVLFKKAPKTLLDIGCGYGFWMNYCRQKGLKDVEGIEPVTEASEWAMSNFHVPVHQVRLEDFEPQKRYDAVIMCDILEHLQNPNKELSRIYEFLSPDGVLMIQVPNVIGIKYPSHPIWGLPYHLWQFQIATLIRLLRKHRFSIQRYWTGTMGVIGRYEARGPTWIERTLWKIANALRFGNRLILIAGKECS